MQGGLPWPGIPPSADGRDVGIAQIPDPDLKEEADEFYSRAMDFLPEEVADLLRGISTFAIALSPP